MMEPGSLLSDVEKTGNLVEAGFWMIFAPMVAIGARNQRRPIRLLGRTASLISVLFGVSDLVESRTGAWWRPWWLLVWKGLCVAGLVLCFLKYRGLRSGEVLPEKDSPQAPSSSM
jgi:hypothetical protein